MPVPPLPLAAIRQPAFLYGADGRIAAANDRAEALAGRPLAGCSAADVIGIFGHRTPGGTPLAPSALPACRALAGEEVVNLPLAITAADGRAVHVLASAAPLRGEAEAAGALTIWQDVSVLEAARAGAEASAMELEVQQEELRQQGGELVRAIADLDRQRRLLDAILAALPHRVSLWDRDLRLVWANERFAAEHGLPREALVGRPWGELGYNGTVVGPCSEEALRATSAGGPFSCEVEVAGPKGTSWMAVTAVPIFGDSVLVISEDITERKRAEDALRENVETVRALIDSPADMALLLDVNGIVLEISDSYAAVLGRPARELIGTCVWEVMLPEVVGYRRANFDRAVESRRIVRLEEHRNGRWYDSTLNPILSDGSRVDRVAIIAREITARKEAEGALQRSLERLSVAQAAARCGFWNWDVRTDELTWSPELFDLFDLAPTAGMTLDAWLGLIHPDDRESAMAAIDRSIDDRIPIENEYRILLPGGQVRWISTLGDTAYDDEGLPLRMAGICVDITERKRAEEALRESEAKYRSLFEDDITGDVIVTPDGRILDCNPAFARIFGFASVDEARSSTMAETYDTPADREARLARLRTERRLENDEGFRRRRDGTRIHIVENVIGDFDDAGELVQIRGYIRDDTERYRAEEALKKSERRHAFLLALGDSLRELADVREIAAVASELVGRHLGVNGVVYCEVDEAEKCATVRADWTDGTVPDATGLFCMDDFGIGDLYRRGLVRRTGDITTMLDEDETAEHCALRIRASLGVPICRGGRLAAVLAVHSARPRTWTDAEAGLVREAGDRVWSAVERARTEEALRMSEERLRLAQENAGIGIWDLNAAKDQVTITPGFLRRFGLETKAVFSYEELVRLIHPDDRERADAGQRTALDTGGSLDLEFRVVTPSGEARWVHFKGRGVADGLSACNRLIGVILDVTARRRVEEALHEREQTLQSIFRAAPVGIGMVSHRIVTQANDQLCRMTGFTQDDLVGQDARLLYLDDEAYADAGREKYAMIAEQGIGVVETQWRMRDGTILDILLSSSPMDLSRPREDVVFIALDITKLRESERALESYMDDLQRSNEELQRFAYVASHDLQEPLRSIISFSQLLERRYKGKLDQDADEYIQFIVEGGNRMQRLIMDLLQLSRVETKAKPLVPTDAGVVVADALRLMETPIREAGATVTVEELPTVMADAAQLEQVFTNLVGNALKYRRPDVPSEVRISAECEGHFWRFAVADNGIGIEAEYFDRIFVIFQRLHTRDEYEGTGIGLAVVRKIVERHGGRIGVESTPGEGSTFFFTLPAA